MTPCSRPEILDEIIEHLRELDGEVDRRMVALVAEYGRTEMDGESERLAGIAKQADEQYLGLGRFVAKFEELCMAVRESTIMIFHREGLRNRKVAELALAGVMAEDLIKMFHSMVAEITKGDQMASQLVGDIRKRMEKLIEARNFVSHNFLFISWAGEDDVELGPASGLRARRSQDGIRYESKQFTAADFEALAEEAAKLTVLVFRLGGCLIGGNLVERNFTPLGNGEWHDRGPQAS